MLTADYLPDFIGQAALKNQINFHLESYKATGFFPSTIVNARRGAGKTRLCSLVAERLQKPWLHVTGSSVKKLDRFMDNVILPHVIDKKITLFVDEIHAVSKDVFTALLTILEPKPERRTIYNHQGTSLTFDFHNFTFLSASTNLNKIPPPLIDRMRRLDFQDYTNRELKLILMMHSTMNYDKKVIEDIIGVSRRSCRRLVQLAEDLRSVGDIKNIKVITPDIWESFKKQTAIYPLGLNETEILYLRALSQKGRASLTALAATLCLDIAAIRSEVEIFLHQTNLIFIDGKRGLTSKGQEIVKRLEIEE